MYVHCISHCLNMCLMKAGEVTGIKRKNSHTNERNCRFLSQFKPENKKTSRSNPTEIYESLRIRLKQHCATRLVEKQKAVRVCKCFIR